MFWYLHIFRRQELSAIYCRPGDKAVLRDSATFRHEPLSFEHREQMLTEQDRQQSTDDDHGDHPFCG